MINFMGLVAYSSCSCDCRSESGKHIIQCYESATAEYFNARHDTDTWYVVCSFCCLQRYVKTYFLQVIRERI